MTSIYRAIVELIEKGEAGAVCSIIESSGSTPRHEGSKMLVYEDGRFIGTVGGGEVESRIYSEAQKAIQDGKSRLLRYSMVDPKQGDPGICGGTLEVYVEPILPAPVLVVVGGGHVGKAVAHLAKWLGFRVAINDDRPEFCNKDANPDGDDFYPYPMAELPEHLKINSQTYIVLTTRGSNIDVLGLPYLLNTSFGYLGIIGSRRRWLTTRSAMVAAGIPEEKLSRVHSPLGLELKAESPEEIAVSIMAEIIMLRNGGTGKSMKA
ncbi:MAG TPA: XdhC family protein [Anaerolineaceae bacterium]|nr:XdhC family protein [Anaerolineaceae bacterium]